MPHKPPTKTKATIRPGDVVTVDFPGMTGIKRRPALIVSTEVYHSARPDVIIAILTSQVQGARAVTDFVLKDWTSAGLRQSSAFRAFLATVHTSSVQIIGHRSDRDWQEVLIRLKQAISVA